MPHTTTMDSVATVQQSQDRLDVLQRIAHNERNQLFNEDVENDAPTIPLDARKLDMLNKRWTSKILNKVGNFFGKRFYATYIKEPKVIYKAAIGLENLKELGEGGAMITCNHCHIFDNYAVYLTLKQHFTSRKFVLYKVVREGNYSYPGIIGFLMRHCNTLPVQQGAKNPNIRLTATAGQAMMELLKRGEKVLIYPEQSMWWNYKKPRPTKRGAFHFAAKAGVPIVPMFITFKDTDIMGKDGFLVREFTVHVMPAIHADPALSTEQNVTMMQEKNFELCKQKYESVYGIPLEYDTIVQ